MKRYPIDYQHPRRPIEDGPEGHRLRIQTNLSFENSFTLALKLISGYRVSLGGEGGAAAAAEEGAAEEEGAEKGAEEGASPMCRKRKAGKVSSLASSLAAASSLTSSAPLEEALLGRRTCTSAARKRQKKNSVNGPNPVKASTMIQTKSNQRKRNEKCGPIKSPLTPPPP